MPPLSVMGEVYCFSRRQLIFSFGRHVMSTFRNRFRMSVCTTVFKRIAGLHFYPKYLI